MSDLRELYQEIVLDHNSKPRNFRKAEQANRKAEGFNPICGDRVILYVELEGDQIKDVSFQGTGCAISRASASMMTETVKGKSKADAQRLFDMFHQQVIGADAPAEETDELGDLESLAGIREYPSRVKCVSLAWHALRSALDGEDEPVSTESD